MEKSPPADAIGLAVMIGKIATGEIEDMRDDVKSIKRSDKAKGFQVLPRRWVIERTFAWLGRCRRLAKDWEKSIESSTAWATIASIRMLTRRISSNADA